VESELRMTLKKDAQLIIHCTNDETYYPVSPEWWCKPKCFRSMCSGANFRMCIQLSTHGSLKPRAHWRL